MKVPHSFQGSAKIVLILALGTLLVTGCARNAPDDRPGTPQRYTDPASPDGTGGVGIEANDIVSVTDRMARDLMATPEIINWETAPRIVVDARYFRNEGSSRVNRNLFTDRLRVNLARASRGKLTFLGRHYSDMVEDERELESDGVVTGGTQGETSEALGWDYRLGGRIASLDKVVPSTGALSRYHQITFELVERGSGAIVWTNMYEFQKVDEVDAIYR